MPGFEELEVWKRGVELSASIYKETRRLYDYGFRDQITRAGLSIPSNIAEGVERSTSADRCKFLDYARGSCGEVRTQTIVGMKVGFIDEVMGNTWCDETRQLAAMINGLIRSIRSQPRNHKLPLPTANCQLPPANCQLTTFPCLLRLY